MKIGYTTMNTPADIAPRILGPLLEDAGFESIWIGEHSHIPVSRATPYPTGGDMPWQYTTMMDPFISLTQIGEHMLFADERRFAHPGHAFAAHLGEAFRAAIHPQSERVAANARIGAHAFGNDGRGIMRTAGAEMRRAGGD